MTRTFEVAVIGGGPSGMMAAIAAAQQGSSVCLLEHGPRPGRKLLVTGGGRCNITNTLRPSQFSARFHAKKNFITPALRLFSSRDLTSFFADRGVPCVSVDSVHVHPETKKAGAVLGVLEQQLRKLDVQVVPECHVTGVLLNGKTVEGVKCRTTSFASSSVVLATGGQSYAHLGSDGSGYAIARSAGYAITTPVPALAGLTTSEEWPRSCAGTTLEHGGIRLLSQPGKVSLSPGNILFTHKGISGPAALDISGIVSRILLQQAEVPVGVVPRVDTTGEQWNERFIRWQQEHGSALIRSLLGRFMPSRLANLIAVQCGLFSTRAADLTKPARKRLTQVLSEGILLTVQRTEGFGKAMVTSGGVSLDQVSCRSLAGTKTRGLYFCGEVLDIDGPCGGFNLQWAFSSGYLAGVSASQHST